MSDPGNSSALALEQNLAVSAGAGAGKTHNLITLCLHLLGGARAGGAPIRTPQLFMVTFTDKAASEMRDRLRRRLDGLARGQDESEELLRASFERHGYPFPPRSFWRRVRDELGEATIGTFHSLCASLLRRAPAGGGTDPGFNLLDEREGQALIRDCAERTVLEFLEAGDSAAVDLCRELNFLDRGRGGGLVTHLCAIFSKLREEGLTPESVPISEESAARAEFDEALSSLRRAVAEASDFNARERGEFADALEASSRALEGMTVDNFPVRFGPVQASIDSTKGSRRRNGLADALKTVKHAALGNGNGRPGLRDCYGGWAMIPYERAFRRMLGALRDRHRAELNRRASLDFCDLLIRTRDLLRDHPDLRREVQERIGALLVDEFQDTNRLQLQIVLLLAEKRAGSPRALRAEQGSQELEMPLEPRLLCAVGDRKQSIYEFRGADVSVFELLAQKVEAEGGRRAYLRSNRRSSPALVTFFNRTFAHLMRAAPEARAFEIAYHSETDSQQPIRIDQRDSAPVDWLVFEPAETAEDCRSREADAIARRIRQLLSKEAPPMVGQLDGSLRKAQGGDIAILFRRFTFVEAYRQALVRNGVPHRIVRGRGFYGAQEVLDLASALALISDPADSLAFAAVLRSPLTCICDASLIKVSTACGGKLSLRRLQNPDALASADLPENERARCERFLSLYPSLRRERDRLGIRVLLRVLLDETQYRVAIAGTPFGEQALANVEKLLELAGRWDQCGKGGCASFARELLALADTDPTEAQADTLDSADRRAVQLLTIHQAKGLEWPIVFVPDMAAQRGRGQASVIFDRQEGLAIRMPLSDGLDPPRPPRFARGTAELARREDAEHLRLLYVALTRSRDHLVLSGQGNRSAKTWRGIFEKILASEQSVRELVRELKADELPLPAPEPLECREPTADSERRVEAAVRRVRIRQRPCASTAVFPVTQLQDFALCPRRFLYAHRAGLSEHPSILEIEESGLPPPLGGRSAIDKRTQGTLAHRLLERVDLRLAYGSERAQKDHLDSLVWEEGADPSAADAREVVAWTEGFLRSPFARRLAAAGPSRVHRELPFLLRLEGAGACKIHLKGQIDLVFQDDEGRIMVIDYKTGERHPEGLAPYAFQLDCYALAAQQFASEGISVHTGIVFLQQQSPQPEMRLPLSPQDLRAFERRLVAAASDLLEATERGEWAGQPQNRCAEIRCGYQYRCHASAPAL
jgi:ATP-dependent helicase/nuclease subunit A